MFLAVLRCNEGKMCSVQVHFDLPHKAPGDGKSELPICNETSPVGEREQCCVWYMLAISIIGESGFWQVFIQNVG